MDFALSEEHKMLQTMVRDFATDKLAPVADELDRKQEFAWDNFKMMADMGLLGLTIPPEYGGSGGSELSIAIAVEELARACPSTADILDAHLCLCAAPIYCFGTEELKQRFVPPLAKGEKIGAFAITETEAGSDVSSLKMTAVRDGDYYILNGTKIFITSGDVCDTLLVFAAIPELGARGMTAFIVEKGTPGYSARYVDVIADFPEKLIALPGRNGKGSASNMRNTVRITVAGQISVRIEPLGK